MFGYAGLQPASFRGASFLCPNDKDQGGVNCVHHKFPGSRSHYVEPNGVEQGEYHLKCVLHGPDLLGQWSRLQAALDTPAVGTLKHPWLGVKLCVARAPWHVTRDDRDIGVLEVEVTFLETGPPKFPGIVVGIAASISGLSASAISLSFANLTANFAVPTGQISSAYVSSVMGGVAASVLSRFPQVADVALASRVINNATLPR